MDESIEKIHFKQGSLSVEESLGKVPLLAIPDVRYLNKVQENSVSVMDDDIDQ